MSKTEINIVNKLMHLTSLYQSYIKGNTDDQNEEINKLLTDICNKLELGILNGITARIIELKTELSDNI